MMHAPAALVASAVARALAEDLEPIGDLTAALLDQNIRASVVIASREHGVIAGQACMREAFIQVDPSIVVDIVVDDGGAVHPGDVVARVSGPMHSILSAERTALNFLGHLSGIATATAAMVAVVRDVSSTTRVLDTRKTTPGLRGLEKAAVRAGGGTNHRMNLSDAVLIKDNHIGVIGITEAVTKASAMWPGRSVEVECDHLSQVEEAARAGATSILLDNMSPDQAYEATLLARSLAPSILVEVSGRITLDNAAAYAATGVDSISSGSLTHSVTCLDVGLDLTVEVL
jgi:nicotinate-nucleotide pyrophosphorylase (carboxylating)